MSAGDEGAVPPIDFTTFVLSMSTACMTHIGEIGAASDTDRSAVAMAHQTLEILGMLEEKTQGNLSGEEERILTQVLADLREAFAPHAK